MKVGVHELSRHTSRYLARVKAGETLDITEHGRVIATISPTGQERVRRPRPHLGYANSGDPSTARRVDELFAEGFAQ
jgi:prevent-host-death family protein